MEIVVAMIVTKTLNKHFQVLQKYALLEGEPLVESLKDRYCWIQLSWLISFAKLNAEQIFDDRITIANEVWDLTCSHDLKDGAGPGWRALRTFCYSLLIILGRAMKDFGPTNYLSLRRSLHKLVFKADNKVDIEIRKAVSAILSGNDELTLFFQEAMAKDPQT